VDLELKILPESSGINASISSLGISLASHADEGYFYLKRYTITITPGFSCVLKDVKPLPDIPEPNKVSNTREYFATATAAVKPSVQIGYKRKREKDDLKLPIEFFYHSRIGDDKFRFSSWKFDINRQIIQKEGLSFSDGDTLLPSVSFHASKRAGSHRPQSVSFTIACDYVKRPNSRWSGAWWKKPGWNDFRHETVIKMPVTGWNNDNHPYNISVIKLPVEELQIESYFHTTDDPQALVFKASSVPKALMEDI